MVRLALAGSALVAALVAAAPAAQLQPQHDVTASSHRHVVPATLGTHCAPVNGRVRCAEYRYPLRTEERLPIHPGGRIVLDFKMKPQEVDAQLRDRRSRSVYELQTLGRGRERTIRLPRELPPGSDRLGFWARYERGDADFEVDLKRHAH